MGKPLSRPDCLRQNPACLGKGEEEDGYIEDCYVPQRSIYDTMRINEQIDQGGKPSQPSRNTLEKADGSTISSNGTLGAPSALESKAPESKKLDERVIFDALKLSSDASKSAPAPPRRRPNTDKKESVNRRSWKSFMPPNFPEFAERIEASLSEVSEAGASNPSLQEKQGSVPRLAEEAKQPGHLGCTSEPLTMEHAPLVPNIPEIHEVKQLSDAFCGSFQDECQPLLEPEDPGARDLTGRRRRDLSSATWPRAMKNLLKAGPSSGRHDTLEADDTDGIVEMVPLSPCLSEELLDPAMGVLITPNLREKTESELRFEEDERLIMMEGEEGLEEDPLPQGEKVAEERDRGVAGVSEERGQFGTRSTMVAEGAESLAGGWGAPERPSPWQDLWDETAPPQAASSALVPQEMHQDSCALAAAPGEEEEGEDGACGAEAVTAQLDEEDLSMGESARLLVPEQFSDTDSVQIFLELEELCMGEEDGDGAGPEHPEVQDLSLSSEGLGTQKESEQLSENLADASRWVAPLETSVADSAVVSDLEDFDATYGSQAASMTEPTLSESYSERETSGDSENVLFPSPPGAKDAVSQHSLSSLVSQMEECGGSEPLVTRELATYTQVEEVLDVLSEEGEPVGALDPSGSQGGPPCVRVFWEGRGVEEEVPPAPACGTVGRDSPHHQDDLATTAEELDSRAEFDGTKPGEDSGGKELPAGDELNPSERTDLSNWDVPELVSEDEEVADLDQETLLCGGHADERGDTQSSQVHFPLGLAPRLDSEEPVKCKNSSGDLEGAGATWKEQEPPCPLEGSAQPPSGGEMAGGPEALREETPKVDQQEAGASRPAKEREFWEQGDLELLFGQGGSLEDRGWGSAGGRGLASPSSSSPGPPEDFFEAPLCLGDALSRAGEDTVPARPLASNEGIDGPSGGPKELPGRVAGPLPDVGPAEAKETTSSSLPTWFASTLRGEEVVVDATSLPSNADLCGPDGPPEASVPVFPDMDETFPPPPPPPPPPPVLFGTENSPTSPEELLGGGEGVGTSEEAIQATQEAEDLATLSALSVEGLEAEAGPPEMEDGAVLWASGGILPTSPLWPASTAPGAEEQLALAMPSGEGPSTDISASSLAAEGAPDGLVPDNEVLASW